ncbi:hypothetical protein [Candidatus Amarobacter glycogenicus]|uniref:hypothetical protein n=1 Tax=Candidatus Amarobacter glycogenicus TaxID=3140699 RepID=UPI0031349E51|nr:hypothetical protein [Dehalococcoidia bacterium]
MKIGPVTARGDGSFSRPSSPSRPIAVGYQRDLRATGGGQHINWFSHHITSHDITGHLDRSSDLATGTAPPAKPSSSAPRTWDGRQEVFRANADGAGAFSVAMALRRPTCFGPPGKCLIPARATASAGRLAARPVRVVDLPISQVPAEPGRMLTFHFLRSAAGAIKAQSPTQADDQRAATSSSISSARRGPSSRRATASRSRLPTTSAILLRCVCSS